jgi:hypothetical protein
LRVIARAQRALEKLRESSLAPGSRARVRSFKKKRITIRSTTSYDVFVDAGKKSVSVRWSVDE